MIRDITIGQYYPAKSVLHRLDPRVKLVGTLLYLISLFLFNSIPGYVMTTLFLILVIRISKVPFSFYCKRVKTGHHAFDDHGVVQLISDEGWSSVVPCMDFHDHRRRSQDSGIYGNPADLSDHRFVTYDIYNDPE